MSKTNPRIHDLIAELKATARKHDAEIWADLAGRLERPRSSYAEVNIGRIERYAREDETVIVPGKVLGSGTLRKHVTVGAVDFSRSAEDKIEAVGEACHLEELIARHPDGANLRVIA